MYNDKTTPFSPEFHRDLPPRVAVGRSRPEFTRVGAQVNAALPSRERPQKRLCNGELLTDQDAHLPRAGFSPRNEETPGQHDCNAQNEGCGEYIGGWGLPSHPLAMVYAPLQQFRELYDPEIALERGTVFTELDLPFEGDKTKRGGCKLC